MERTILLTGAQGLLGSHLLPLLAGENRVVALARSPVPATPNVTPLTADLSRPLDLEALPSRLDAVIYLAQSPRFREFPGGAEDMAMVNLRQPLVLIEEARRRGARSFVYASTGGVYGTSEAPLQESAPTPPPGQRLPFYPASKLAAELLLGSYADCMHVVVLRFFFIYGAGQQRQMLIPRLVDAVRTGQPVTLQGSSGLRLNPVHARDAARASLAALGVEKSCAVNVAGGETLSIRQICEIVGERLGREPVFEEQPGSAPSLVGDISAMSRLLGAPQVSFEQGIVDVL